MLIIENMNLLHERKRLFFFLAMLKNKINIYHLLTFFFHFCDFYNKNANTHIANLNFLYYIPMCCVVKLTHFKLVIHLSIGIQVNVLYYFFQ